MKEREEGAAEDARLEALCKRIRILERKLTRSEENRGLLEEALESHILALKATNQELLKSQHTIRESEERYRNLALYDPLTLLPNRILLFERLKRSMCRAELHRLPLAVLFIDLDRFKEVNDKYGHAAGDVVLKETGIRLRACIRGDDTAARLSGDEFVVLLESLRGVEEITRIVQRILTALAAPYVVDVHTFVLGASIGVSRHPDDGQDPEELLRKADAAMYSCKKRRGNSWNFFYSSPL